jgi:hypothetical protein
VIFERHCFVRLIAGTLLEMLEILVIRSFNCRGRSLIFVVILFE